MGFVHLSYALMIAGEVWIKSQNLSLQVGKSYPGHLVRLPAQTVCDSPASWLAMSKGFTTHCLRNAGLKDRKEGNLESKRVFILFPCCSCE